MIREFPRQELNAEVDRLSVQIIAERLEEHENLIGFEKTDRLLILQSIIDLEKEFSKAHAKKNPRNSTHYLITDTDLELYQIITVITVDLDFAESNHSDTDLEEENRLMTNRANDLSILGYRNAVEEYSVFHKK